MVVINKEIPRNCMECFCNYDWYSCSLNGMDTSEYLERRRDDCLLIDLEETVNEIYHKGERYNV